MTSLSRSTRMLEATVPMGFPPLPRVPPVRQLNEKLLSIVFKDGPLTAAEQEWLDAFEKESVS